MAVYLLFRTFQHLRVEKIPVRRFRLSSGPHVRSVYGEKNFLLPAHKRSMKKFLSIFCLSLISQFTNGCGRGLMLMVLVLGKGSARRFLQLI